MKQLKVKKILKHNKDGNISREKIRAAFIKVKKENDFKDFIRSFVSQKLADIICYNEPLEILDKDIENIVLNVHQLEKK